MDFLLTLAVIVLVSKIFGEVAERMQYPSVLGYLMAGMLLGPLPLMVSGHSIITLTEELSLFAELGAILILFSAGIREINLNLLLRNKIASFGSSLLGYVLSFMMVVFIGLGMNKVFPYFALNPVQIIVAAIALSITSITTSVRVLIDIKKLNTDMGKTILASSVIDDILGLVLFVMVFSIFSQYARSFESIIKIVVFAAITCVVFVVGSHILPSLVGKMKALEVEEAQFSIAFVLMLAFAYMTQLFGFHGIMGAFLAGAIISRTPLKDSGFSEKLASLTYGIFAPLFFAWVGMLVDPRYFFVVVLLVVCGVLASNFLGAFMGACIGGMKPLEAVGVGIGVLPRGGFDLVILAIAKRSGILDSIGAGILFNAGVLLAVVSIVITPMLFRMTIEGKEIK